MLQQLLKHSVPANVRWQLISIFPGAALSLFSIDEESEIIEAMNLERLLSKPPKLHGRDGATTDGWRLDDAGLLFLDSRVKTGMRTIETGAGVSTIALALKRAQHTCVVRDGTVVRRIRQYCAAAGISLNTVRFVVGRSEYALPKLQRSGFDFDLIDGRHGFPGPFMDWFYIPSGSGVAESSSWTIRGSGLATSLFVSSIRTRAGDDPQPLPAQRK